MRTSDTIKERELPLSGQPVCNALAPAVCSMPSGPVSDAASHYTARWSPVTVTKRADPPPDRPDGNSGVRRVTRDGWTDASVREAALLPIRPQQRVPRAPWACSQEPSWAIGLSPNLCPQVSRTSPALAGQRRPRGPHTTTGGASVAPYRA